MRKRAILIRIEKKVDGFKRNHEKFIRQNSQKENPSHCGNHRFHLDFGIDFVPLSSALSSEIEELL